MRFAVTAWGGKSQSRSQFGSRERRSRNGFLADEFEGKLAEIAVLEFLSKSGLEVSLDFEHYARIYDLDSGDLVGVLESGEWRTIQGHFDVKGTTARAQWLLTEEHKAVADIYILVRFPDMPGKAQARANPLALVRPWQAEVVGWAYRTDLFEEGTENPLFRFNKGERPRSTGTLPAQRPRGYTALQARTWLANAREIGPELAAPANWGLPVKWLRRDWGRLIREIRDAAR